MLFEAKNMTRDGDHCFDMAMEVAMRMNMNKEPEEAVSVEETFAAAAVAYPELAMVTVDGAPVLTGSCVMLLASLLMTFFL